MNKKVLIIIVTIVIIVAGGIGAGVYYLSSTGKRKLEEEKDNTPPITPDTPSSSESGSTTQPVKKKKVTTSVVEEEEPVLITPKTEVGTVSGSGGVKSTTLGSSGGTSSSSGTQSNTPSTGSGTLGNISGGGNKITVSTGGSNTFGTSPTGTSIGSLGSSTGNVSGSSGGTTVGDGTSARGNPEDWLKDDKFTIENKHYACQAKDEPVSFCKLPNLYVKKCYDDPEYWVGYMKECILDHLKDTDKDKYIEARDYLINKKKKLEISIPPYPKEGIICEVQDNLNQFCKTPLDYIENCSWIDSKNIYSCKVGNTQENIAAKLDSDDQVKYKENTISLSKDCTLKSNTSEDKYVKQLKDCLSTRKEITDKTQYNKARDYLINRNSSLEIPIYSDLNCIYENENSQFCSKPNTYYEACKIVNNRNNEWYSNKLSECITKFSDSPIKISKEEYNELRDTLISIDKKYKNIPPYTTVKCDKVTDISYFCESDTLDFAENCNFPMETISYNLNRCLEKWRMSKEDPKKVKMFNDTRDYIVSLSGAFDSIINDYTRLECENKDKVDNDFCRTPFEYVNGCKTLYNRNYKDTLYKSKGRYDKLMRSCLGDNMTNVDSWNKAKDLLEEKGLILPNFTTVDCTLKDPQTNKDTDYIKRFCDNPYNFISSCEGVNDTKPEEYKKWLIESCYGDTNIFKYQYPSYEKAVNYLSEKGQTGFPLEFPDMPCNNLVDFDYLRINNIKGCYYTGSNKTPQLISTLKNIVKTHELDSNKEKQYKEVKEYLKNIGYNELPPVGNFRCDALSDNIWFKPYDIIKDCPWKEEPFVYWAKTIIENPKNKCDTQSISEDLKKAKNYIKENKNEYCTFGDTINIDCNNNGIKVSKKSVSSSEKSLLQFCGDGLVSASNSCNNFNAFNYTETGSFQDMSYIIVYKDINFKNEIKRLKISESIDINNIGSLKVVPGTTISFNNNKRNNDLYVNHDIKDFNSWYKYIYLKDEFYKGDDTKIIVNLKKTNDTFSSGKYKKQDNVASLFRDNFFNGDSLLLYLNEPILLGYCPSTPGGLEFCTLQIEWYYNSLYSKTPLKYEVIKIDWKHRMSTFIEVETITVDNIADISKNFPFNSNKLLPRKDSGELFYFINLIDTSVRVNEVDILKPSPQDFITRPIITNDKLGLSNGENGTWGIITRGWYDVQERGKCDDYCTMDFKNNPVNPSCILAGREWDVNPGSFGRYQNKSIGPLCQAFGDTGDYNLCNSLTYRYNNVDKCYSGPNSLKTACETDINFLLKNNEKCNNIGVDVSSIRCKEDPEYSISNPELCYSKGVDSCVKFGSYISPDKGEKECGDFLKKMCNDDSYLNSTSERTRRCLINVFNTGKWYDGRSLTEQKCQAIPNYYWRNLLECEPNLYNNCIQDDKYYSLNKGLCQKAINPCMFKDYRDKNQTSCVYTGTDNTSYIGPQKNLLIKWSNPCIESKEFLNNNIDLCRKNGNEICKIDKDYASYHPEECKNYVNMCNDEYYKYINYEECKTEDCNNIKYASNNIIKCKDKLTYICNYTDQFKPPVTKCIKLVNPTEEQKQKITILQSFNAEYKNANRIDEENELHLCSDDLTTLNNYSKEFSNFQECTNPNHKQCATFLYKPPSKTTNTLVNKQINQDILSFQQQNPKDKDDSLCGNCETSAKYRETFLEDCKYEACNDIGFLINNLELCKNKYPKDICSSTGVSKLYYKQQFNDVGCTDKIKSKCTDENYFYNNGNICSVVGATFEDTITQEKLKEICNNPQGMKQEVDMYDSNRNKTRKTIYSWSDSIKEKCRIANLEPCKMDEYILNNANECRKLNFEPCDNTKYYSTNKQECMSLGYGNCDDNDYMWKERLGKCKDSFINKCEIDDNFYNTNKSYCEGLSQTIDCEILPLTQSACTQDKDGKWYKQKAIITQQPKGKRAKKCPTESELKESCAVDCVLEPSGTLETTQCLPENSYYPYTGTSDKWYSSSRIKHVSDSQYGGKCDDKQKLTFCPPEDATYSEWYLGRLCMNKGTGEEMSPEGKVITTYTRKQDLSSKYGGKSWKQDKSDLIRTDEFNNLDECKTSYLKECERGEFINNFIINKQKCEELGADPCSNYEYSIRNVDKCSSESIKKMCSSDIRYLLGNTDKCRSLGIEPCNNGTYAYGKENECRSLGVEPCNNKDYLMLGYNQCREKGIEPCENQEYYSKNKSDCDCNISYIEGCEKSNIDNKWYKKPYVNNPGRGLGKKCDTKLELNPTCDPIDCVIDTNLSPVTPNGQCMLDTDGKYYKNNWYLVKQLEQYGGKCPPKGVNGDLDGGNLKIKGEECPPEDCKVTKWDQQCYLDENKECMANYSVAEIQGEKYGGKCDSSKLSKVDKCTDENGINYCNSQLPKDCVINSWKELLFSDSECNYDDNNKCVKTITQVPDDITPEINGGKCDINQTRKITKECPDSSICDLNKCRNLQPLSKYPVSQNDCPKGTTFVEDTFLTFNMSTMKQEPYNSCAVVIDDKSSCYTNKEGSFSYSQPRDTLTNMKKIVLTKKECSSLLPTIEPQSQSDCPSNFKFVKDFTIKEINNKLTFGNSCVKLDTDDKSVLCYSTQGNNSNFIYRDNTIVLSVPKENRSYFSVDTMLQNTKNRVTSSQPLQRIRNTLKFSDYNQYIRTLDINI